MHVLYKGAGAGARIGFSGLRPSGVQTKSCIAKYYILPSYNRHRYH